MASKSNPKDCTIKEQILDLGKVGGDLVIRFEKLRDSPDAHTFIFVSGDILPLAILIFNSIQRENI